MSSMPAIPSCARFSSFSIGSLNRSCSLFAAGCPIWAGSIFRQSSPGLLSFSSSGSSCRFSPSWRVRFSRLRDSWTLASLGREPWTATGDGLLVDVRLTPRGGVDATECIETRADGRAVLKARERAAPSDGEANDALCRFLARALDVPPRDVTIATGATARIKRVSIKGRANAIVAALQRLVGLNAYSSFRGRDGACHRAGRFGP